jgi:hypothetical protein
MGKAESHALIFTNTVYITTVKSFVAVVTRFNLEDFKEFREKEEILSSIV